MADTYHSPGTGPKVDWQARYEAMRSVARKLRRGLKPGDTHWWKPYGASLNHVMQDAPVTPDERRALDELEADRG